MKLDLPYRFLEGVHRFAARVLGGAIGWIWRVSGKVPLRLRLMLGFLALGATLAGLGWFLSARYASWAQFSAENLRVLGESGALAGLARMAPFAYGVAAFCALAALLSWVPLKFAYRVLEAAYAAWLLGVLAAARLAFGIPASLYAADYKLFDRLSRNALWTASLGVLVPVALIGLLMLLALALSSVRRAYGIGRGDSIGDRIVSGFRTGGSDPRYRTSWY